MLRALRTARCGQVVLWIAGFLAIAGSFGLHPEPDRAASLAPAAPLPGWISPLPAGNASHDCLACLAHRSVSLARPSGVVLQPGLILAVVFSPRVIRLGRVESRHHEGRAPPALS